MTTSIRSHSHALNDQVLKVLGLSDQAHMLTRVVLTLEPNKLPTALLERTLNSNDLVDLSSETAWTELQLAHVDVPVFNAEAECAAALARVSQAIEANAAAAVLEVSTRLVDLRYELHARLDRAEAALATRRRLHSILDTMLAPIRPQGRAAEFLDS